MMGQFEQLESDANSTRRNAANITGRILWNFKAGILWLCAFTRLDRVAHGIYLSKDSWVDAMYLLHLRFEQAVFSHETALFFHDLTDREPIEYTVTVKTGCNPSKMKAEGIQVFTIKADLHDVGLTTAKTPFGILCRFMIWSERSVICSEAVAELKFRPFREHWKRMPVEKIRTCEL